jgi:hypothetical protein
MFENRVLRRMLGPRRDEATEGRGNCITRNLKFCSSLNMLGTAVKDYEMGGPCRTYGGTIHSFRRNILKEKFSW